MVVAMPVVLVVGSGVVVGSRVVVVRAAADGGGRRRVVDTVVDVSAGPLSAMTITATVVVDRSPVEATGPTAIVRSATGSVGCSAMILADRGSGNLSRSDGASSDSTLGGSVMVSSSAAVISSAATMSADATAMSPATMANLTRSTPTPENRALEGLISPLRGDLAVWFTESQKFCRVQSCCDGAFWERDSFQIR